jgi:hypothetical protein
MTLFCGRVVMQFRLERGEQAFALVGIPVRIRQRVEQASLFVVAFTQGLENVFHY